MLRFRQGGYVHTATTTASVGLVGSKKAMRRKRRGWGSPLPPVSTTSQMGACTSREKAGHRCRYIMGSGRMRGCRVGGEDHVQTATTTASVGFPGSRNITATFRPVTISYVSMPRFTGTSSSHTDRLPAIWTVAI